MLAYFGFTHCRVVCPRALSKLSGVLDQLGPRADNIAALYITTDPDRDTPEVMRDYLSDEYPRFTGLTGSTSAIDAAKATFRVFATRKDDPEDPDGYAVPHSAIAYFMAPNGDYVAHFADTVDAETITKRINAAIDAEAVSRQGN